MKCIHHTLVDNLQAWTQRLIHEMAEIGRSQLSSAHGARSTWRSCCPHPSGLPEWISHVQTPHAKDSLSTTCHFPPLLRADACRRRPYASTLVAKTFQFSTNARSSKDVCFKQSAKIWFWELGRITKRNSYCLFDILTWLWTDEPVR